LLFWLVFWPSLSPKPLEVVVPTVPDKPADPTVLEEAVVPAPLVKDATEVLASAIVAAPVLNVDLTDVEPLVVTALLDKPVSMESVQELVHLNVFVQMVHKEVVVGIDVVAAVETAQLVTDAEMELVNATPAVKTNTVVMMVVEELVEPAKVELSAKEPMILIQDNVTLTVLFQSVLLNVSLEMLLLLLLSLLEVQLLITTMVLHSHQPMALQAILSLPPHQTM
jgi:hypothetical protein